MRLLHSLAKTHGSFDDPDLVSHAGHPRRERRHPAGNWTPIRYPRAIWDDQLGAWISDAGVAEIQYTAFASSKG